MGRNAKKPECQTHTGNTTPEQILQFINSLYHHWLLNEYGFNSIFQNIVSIANKSKNFMLCRAKLPDGTEKEYCIEEYLDCYRIVFKAKVSMYRCIECANGEISNPQLLYAANALMFEEITSKVLNLILDNISRLHMPIINSEASKNAYFTLFRNYLSQHVASFADIANKRFILIIRK